MRTPSGNTAREAKGLRDRTVTRSLRACSFRTRRRPTKPLPPAMTIRLEGTASSLLRPGTALNASDNLRQLNRHGATLTGVVLGAERSAVRLHRLPGNGQPETVPALVLPYLNEGQEHSLGR